MHSARRFFGRWAATVGVAATLAVSGVAQAQEEPPSVLGEETTQNAQAPCLEPPPTIRLRDYQGPLRKVVGAFASKLERRSVDASRYQPGVLLCTLPPGAKFRLFVRDSLDPISLLGVGFNAGLDQAQNSDPTFGQGSAGFGKRLAANFASQTSSRFFSEFVYPTIFSEDPRYYRLGQGGFQRRFLHALGHAVIAHRDDGSNMFNFAEVLGTATGAAVGYAYHPGRQRGFGPAAAQAVISIVSDSGFDVLREFWPEVSHKLHMPFRGVKEGAPK